MERRGACGQEGWARDGACTSLCRVHVHDGCDAMQPRERKCKLLNQVAVGVFTETTHRVLRPTRRSARIHVC